MTKNSGNLSTRQKKLIEALITERKPVEAMEKAGISQSTYYRWRSDPVFIQALHKAESAGMNEASRRLIAGSDNIIEKLETMLNNPKLNDSVMLRVIQVYADLLFKFRDQSNIEERLTELEKLAGAK
jgi:hypothetical protein